MPCILISPFSRRLWRALCQATAWCGLIIGLAMTLWCKQPRDPASQTPSLPTPCCISLELHSQCPLLFPLTFYLVSINKIPRGCHDLHFSPPPPPPQDFVGYIEIQTDLMASGVVPYNQTRVTKQTNCSVGVTGLVRNEFGDLVAIADTVSCIPLLLLLLPLNVMLLVSRKPHQQRQQQQQASQPTAALSDSQRR